MKRITLYASTIILICGGSLSSLAFLAPEQAPLTNFDQRLPLSLSSQAIPAEKDRAVSELRASVPQARVEFDSITRAPASVSALDNFLAPSGGLSAAARVEKYGPTRAFIRSHSNLFGH